MKYIMLPEGSSDDDYNTDAASHPYFELHSSRSGRRQQSRREEDVDNVSGLRCLNLEALAAFADRGAGSLQTVLASQLQDMVVRALVQSTTSLVGSLSGLLHHAGEAAIGFPKTSNEEPIATSTWKESTYNSAAARRRKKPEMMRTSASEDSDSQEDFPLPENCTSEQRALRTRRLNRWRGKRANDLTSNRKAVKKLPYVIHVDGMSKAKGIHRHKWKAAVRGQCGRLDPSMDNINHHPKHVVDSIWHALEKEWEFEGFAHKAREMFEKSATKFMRNRKMQLKYKCLKSVDGRKPDDVTDTHWKKIVELTRKSLKNQGAGSTALIGGKAKGSSYEDTIVQDIVLKEIEETIGNVKARTSSEKASFMKQDIEEGSRRRSLECMPIMTSNTVLEEDVDARIEQLRSQLVWLENSRKGKEHTGNEFTEVPIGLSEGKGQMPGIREAESSKENVAPRIVSGESSLPFLSLSSGKSKQSVHLGDSSCEVWRHAPSVVKQNLENREVLGEVPETNTAQMECGDVVKVAADVNGKEEEVGTAILMGFAGSKLSRKVIPKGWCSIKLNSYTTSAASESCPCPCGWKDHMKFKTLREAEGRIILWPENMLHL